MWIVEDFAIPPVLSASLSLVEGNWRVVPCATTVISHAVISLCTRLCGFGITNQSVLAAAASKRELVVPGYDEAAADLTCHPPRTSKQQPLEASKQYKRRRPRTDRSGTGSRQRHDRRSLEMVGARGFEPPTPCPPGRCATRLRHAPT